MSINARKRLTSSDQVINDEDGLSSLDAALLELEAVGSVLLLVGDGDALSGKLSGLADGDESSTEACKGREERISSCS